FGVHFKVETAQPTYWDPTLWPQGASNFSIEDLPTDYLAFWAAADADALGIALNDNSIEAQLKKVVNMLGGESYRTDENPPHCTGADPNCATRNEEFTPRVERIEILHHYWGICPLCFDRPEPRESYSNIPWPLDLTMIKGKPLVPINDGSWRVESCTVTGFNTNPGCSVGRQP